MSQTNKKARRVLLKLSGEVLAGSAGFGIDAALAEQFAEVIRDAVSGGLELGIVVGGGNFWRGRSSGEMDAVTADKIGMLATMMNALAFADILRKQGCTVQIQSAFVMPQIAPSIDAHAARQELKNGSVVLFGGGTGNPFCTTDSTAALRAVEIEAELMLKGTNVDGVYDQDPRRNPNAQRYETLTQTELLQKQLEVMDAAAAALCREKKLAVRVFQLQETENLRKALAGETIGTLITA